MKNLDTDKFMDFWGIEDLEELYDLPYGVVQKMVRYTINAGVDPEVTE